MSSERIVFAHSGSDASTAAIATLAAEHGAEVVTLTLDVGQDQELEDVRDRALHAGAARAHVVDAKEEFAYEFILPALQTGALLIGHEPMAFPLAQSLVGKKLVEIAQIEEAAAVAHHGSGAARARIENAVHALSPGLRVIARGGESGRTAGVRTNLWGRAADAADAPGAPPEAIYAWTKSPSAAPDAGADVEIAFERGVPTAVNGVPLGVTELIESLSIIGGQHGVGRVLSTHEDVRPGALRCIHETPAATVLHAAYEAVESHIVPDDLRRLKQTLRGEYGALAAAGLWFTELREALDAFSAVVQKQVSATVRVRLLKGEYTVTGVVFPGSRIPESRAMVQP
jgi:argininosuccinate synthase